MVDCTLWGGHVQIDTSAIPNDPEGTQRKLEQVRRAALAPADPSTEDRMVAAEASTKLAKARIEAQQQEREEGSAATDDMDAASDNESLPEQGIAAEQNIAEPGSQRPNDLSAVSAGLDSYRLVAAEVPKSVLFQGIG